jgi:hypothetical protein
VDAEHARQDGRGRVGGELENSPRCWDLPYNYRTIANSIERGTPEGLRNALDERMLGLPLPNRVREEHSVGAVAAHIMERRPAPLDLNKLSMYDLSRVHT